MPKVGSWPDDTPEKRAHRISFYAKCGVPLDPTSRVSFTEQVRKSEDCLAGQRTKVMTMAEYMHVISHPTDGTNFSLKDVSVRGPDGKISTETILMTATTEGNAVRCVHSGNIFDAMADIHYNQCHGRKRGGGGCKQHLLDPVLALRKDLYNTVENANRFLSTCPLCDTSSASTVPTTDANNSIVTTSKDTPSKATKVVTPIKAAKATRSGTTSPSGKSLLATPKKAVGSSAVVTPSALKKVAKPAPAACATAKAIKSTRAATSGPTNKTLTKTPGRVQNKIPATSEAAKKPLPGPTKRTAQEMERDRIANLALTFVEELQAMVARLQSDKSCEDTVRLVPLGGLYPTILRMLETQQDLRQGDRPTKVDLGFHYTQKEYMESIGKIGLLNAIERAGSNTFVSFNGSSYGNGIYTASNPYAYHGKYGDVGLIVARLQGLNTDYASNPNQIGCDSSTSMRNSFAEIVVLARSSNCVPILQFDTSQVTPSPVHPGNAALFHYQVELQSIMDRFFNNEEASSRNVKAKQSNDDSISHHQPVSDATCTPEFIRYIAPLSFVGQALSHVTLLVRSPTTKLKCRICRTDRDARMARITACRHTFHRCCLMRALETSLDCPCCGKAVGPPQGKSPGGTMIIRRSNDACEGYERFGTICIDYRAHRDLQKPYHPHPGVEFGYSMRTAYLPDTIAGCRLLERLKYAFTHGLTFTVGVCHATGDDNAVKWTSIPHKTSQTGGPSAFDFPDPNYFTNCNKELDRLGVPKAHH